MSHPRAGHAPSTNPRSILLVQLDERVVYEKAVIRADAVHLPSLAFASLGAVARAQGFACEVLDLSLEDEPLRALERRLQRLAPRYLGLTCTTATITQAEQLAGLARRVAPSVRVLIGGPHVSHLPVETLQNPDIDFVFRGEAEESFAAFLGGAPPETIGGLAFRKDNGEVHESAIAFIEDIDSLPLPDLSLFDLSRYFVSRFYVDENPVIWLETSRGCTSRCKFCAKGVIGNRFRAKSPGRVLHELERTLDAGVREVLLADNGFSSDIARAEAICDGIMERGLKFRWHCVNGLRTDRVNARLLGKMSRAGCVRIAFGIESGNEAILRKNGKSISLAATEAAVRQARAQGIEVWGFFLLGFPEETEQTMLDTIRFACSLPLDLAKANIIVPFPDTLLYQRYQEQGLFYPGLDFSLFNANVPTREIYRHPSLPWDVIERYQRLFYRRFYLSPGFLARRLRYSFRRQLLLSDLRRLLDNLRPDLR